MGFSVGVGFLGFVFVFIWFLDRDRIGGKIFGFKVRYFNFMVFVFLFIIRFFGRFVGKIELVFLG